MGCRACILAVTCCACGPGAPVPDGSGGGQRRRHHASGRDNCIEHGRLDFVDEHGRSLRRIDGADRRWRDELDDEDTAPLLDENAPPVMIGVVTITGSGWKLGGSFTASLCTELGGSFPCE